MKRLKSKRSLFPPSVGLRPIILLLILLTASFAPLILEADFASAATSVVRPDGDVAGGTQFATCQTNGNGTCRYGVLDELALDAGDYISTGTGGSSSSAEQEQFTMSSVAGTDGTVTQVVVKIQALSNGGCQSSCDSLNINISIDGGLQTQQSQTLTASSTLYTKTFTGSWTGDDDLQIRINRVVNGGGSPSNQDDDVRIYQVFAEVTYTPNITFDQSAYRVFDNANSTDVGSPLAAQDTPVTLSTAGQDFRLRTSMHVSTSNLLQSGQGFKLQFAGKGTGTCSLPGGTPSSYTDVGLDGGTWNPSMWQTRNYQQSVAFDGKIWVMGGYDGTGAYFDDVWYSADGTNWTLATSNPGWVARHRHQVLAFNNKLWVIGGNDGTNTLSDVWSSSDGVTWTQEAATTALGARETAAVAVLNNKMWVMGGWDAGAGVRTNDTWSSSDGVTWTEATSNGGWTARSYHNGIAFNGKLWIMGGYDGSSNLDDVWSSSDGVTWTQATANPGWAARQTFGLAVNDNKLWVAGGWIGSRVNDVWSSSDGVTWTQVTASAQWPVRSFHTMVGFNNKLWIMGGLGGSVNYNDTWSSSDGATWTQLAPNSIPSRYQHASVIFNDKIWLMGGYSGGYKNDVWSSSDGKIWAQETASANWSARSTPSAVVFNNKIWLMGGYDGTNRLDEVWSSSDGVNWTLETSNPGWAGRHLHQTVVFNNKIWLMGGYDGSTNLDDIWSSSDGVNWTLETSNPGWAGRNDFAVAILNDKIWLMGGNDGLAAGDLSDVWSSSDGVNWTQVTASAQWGDRQQIAVVGHQGKLWLAGGTIEGASSFFNDVWSSSDGVTWSEETASAGWSARRSFTMDIFNNQLWILGGADSNTKDDTWYAEAGAIDWHNNATPANGDALTDNANDPVHSGHANTNQTYVENNNFTNSQATINNGSDGLWDFSLTDNSAPTGTTYCLRIVRSGGSALDSYTEYMEVTTALPPLTQAGYRWFEDIAETGAPDGGPTKIDDASDFGSILGSGRQVVRDSSGNLFAVVKDDADLEVWMSVDGSSWSLQDSLIVNAGFSEVAAAVDSGNVIHIFFNATAAANYVTYSPGTNSLGTPEVVYSGSYTAGRLSLSIDANDIPHVAYFHSTGTGGPPSGVAVNYANRIGGSWTTTLVEGGGAGAISPNSTSIIVNNDNIPVILFLDSVNARISLYAADQNNPTNFTFVAVDSDVNLTSNQRGAVLANDAAGNTWVAYVDENGASDYMTLAKHNNGDPWSTWQTPVTNSNVGSEPSIAIHNTDVYVFYENGSDDAVYDMYDGSSWAGETVLQTGTFQDIKAKWASSTNNDSQGSVNSLQSYYFDGSDGSVSDPNNVWSIDASAFDGNIDNDASTSSAGSTTANYLEGQGTNAPASGGTIIGVKARIYHSNTGGDETGNAAIYVDGGAGGSSLGTASMSSTGWGNWIDLLVPSGGWTWGKVQSLETRIYISGTSIVQGRVSKVEIMVQTLDVANEIDYLYSDGSDVYWASLGLGPSPTDVGSPLAAQDTAYTMTAANQAVRLRTLVGLDTGNLPIGSDFKLQYAGKGSGSCAAPSGGTPSTYTDITTSTLIAYRDIAGATDGAELTADANDPFRSGIPVIPQTYSESNPFSVLSGLAAGNDGLWGFALKDNSAPGGTTYCLRIVKNSGETLANYTVHPEITTFTGSSNSPPNAPASMSQVKITGGTAISTGGWTNEDQIRVMASATDPDASDTLQLCVERQPLGTPFTGSGEVCGTGVAYSGSAVSVSVDITGLSDDEYHWQARVKDSEGEYSAWVSYGGNIESERDYGVDTTDPTGTVYDGATVGIDASLNDGSLTSLSANWTSTATISGLSGYEYSIGTTAGGTDILGWTSTGTGTSTSASSLSLTTSQVYFFNVRITDNAGNAAIVSSNGTTVAPTLTFGASTSAVNFDALNASNSYTASEALTLTTTTNAQYGYRVYGKATDFLKSQSLQMIDMFNGGTYASPAAWGSGTGFGYHSSDTSVGGINRFNSPTCPGGGSAPCFAPYSTAGIGDVVADATSTPAGGPALNDAVTITNKVSVSSSTQQAGKYQTTILYSAYATY